MQQWNIDDIYPLMDLGQGFSPIDIWYEIHANAQFWAKQNDNDFDYKEQLAVSINIAGYLQNFHAESWIALNHAIGWTKAATTILTWCKNASIKDSFRIWNKLAFQAEILADKDFAALLINPTFLPENRLSTIIACGEHNIQSVCLLLAARSELPEIDIDADLQKRLPPAVVAMLKARGF